MHTPLISAPPLSALARWRASLRGAAFAGVVATLGACGGSADAPPPPDGGTPTPTQTAPVLTQQPVDAAVSAPATVTFSAGASGSPTPTVQWQQSTDGGDTWVDIAGATSTTFTTAATAASDSGEKFRAVFSNAAGSATSNAATLTVSVASSGPASAGLDEPFDVAVDASGTLYVADTFHHVIRKITTDGNVTTLAGQVGVHGDVLGNGSSALLNFPGSITVNAAGTVFISDTSNCEIKTISPAGDVTLLAGHNLPSCIAGLNGTGAAASFVFAVGIRLDGAGNLLVAENDGVDVRVVSPAGVVTTLAGNPTVPQGDADGTGSAATFSLPSAVAIDASGNVFVADEGNDNIRMITPAGVVSHVAGQSGTFGFVDGTGAAARFHEPQGIAVDAAGNLYLADTQNSTIRKIAPGGIVTTLAGSPLVEGTTDGACASARFNQPQGITIDAAGNLYVADTFNNSIRKITPACVVSTVVQ